MNSVAVRRLTAEDLGAVVAIDETIVGRSRRDFFQRRLRAALRDPRLHVQFATEDRKGFSGYVLGRRLLGEFGRSRPAVRLEVIGVRRDGQGHGVGGALVSALNGWAQEHGVELIRTQASWRDHELLRFFDRQKFSLADGSVMGCEVRDAVRTFETVFDDDDTLGPEGVRLARDRIELRVLHRDDTDAVARVDRRLTGRDRHAYIAQTVAEAIDDTAVRVSLTARVDGGIVGFVTAKTDFGNYGRAEPVAILDTLGVDPDFAHHGVGTALLSQLCVNLSGLGVDRIETVVPHEDLALLGFLHAVGFTASERLGFVRRVT